jgi:hypothetical protein
VRRVSYQAALGDSGPEPAAVYVRLADEAISTRRKAARHEISVELSKAQRRWLKDAVARSGAAVDEGAILRALVDLGTELEIDWPAVAKGGELRKAVRESVMVRRLPAAE